MTISTEAFLAINVGASANDGTGDSLRAAFVKVNQNFSNISDIGFDAGNVNVTGGLDIAGVLNVGGMNFLASSNTIQGVNYASLGEISGTKLDIGLILIADTNVGTVDFGAPTVFNDTVVADLYDGDTPSGYGGNIILRSGHNPEVSNLYSASARTVTGGNIEIGGYGTNGIRNYYGNIIIEPNGVTKFSGTGNVEFYGNSLVFGSAVPNPIVFYDGTSQNSAYPGNHFANNTPASSTASGIQGDIWYDASYIYICVATNSWIRALRQAW